MFKVRALACALMVTCTTANAAELVSGMLKREMQVTDASLAECRQVDEKPIEGPRCKQWQATLARAYGEEARQRAQEVAAAEAYARYQAQMAEEQRQQQERAARRKEVEATIAARREADLEQARLERERAEKQAQLAEDRQRAAASRKEAAARAVCGGDFRSPRVGMSVDRVQQCVSSLQMTGQINRVDGVITTYQGGGNYFHVMGGHVVAWGRL